MALDQINQGNYPAPSYLQSQRDLGALFQERARNVESIDNNARASFLADRQIPSQVSGFDLQDAQNVGGLAALPQKLKIEESQRGQQQKFLVLKDLLALVDDQGVPQQVKDELIANGISKITAMNTGVPQEQNLANLDQTKEATSRAAVHTRLLTDLARTRPDAFKQKIMESMQGFAATPESVNAQALENVKGLNAQKLALTEEQKLSPGGGSGAAQEARVLESYRKRVEGLDMAHRRKIRADATAYGLSIIIDQAGNASKPGGKALTKDEQSVYDGIKKEADEEYGRTKAEALRQLEDIKKRYGFSYDSEFLTGLATTNQPRTAAPSPVVAPSPAPAGGARQVMPGSGQARKSLESFKN